MPPSLHPAAHPFALRQLVIFIGLALSVPLSTPSNAQAAGAITEPADTALPDNSTVTTLEEVQIEGSYENRDEHGRNQVFDKDVVNVYQGKEEIERYKGATAGDLFKGMNGVYSGDNRNSGALDPNIRGVQGEGRIPVTIDGTEQATSIWMGPAGVANRNYIDPNLVGSIMVEKGPSLTPGLKSGIGGAVQVRTLEPDDIIQPANTFGMELKTETGTNAVRAQENWKSLFGQDYRDVEGAYSSTDGQINVGKSWGGLEVAPRSGASGKDFNFDDNSFRLAMAKKHEHFDFLAAYSYRKRGNYYSGTHGAEKYQTDTWQDQATAQFNADGGIGGLQSNYVANYFLPGQEVTNTSNNQESYLLKGSLYLPHDQSIKLSYMHSNQQYGESLPWLVSWAVRDEVLEGNQAQLPYSKVKQDTLNLGYSFKPEGNKYINLNANAWMTDSKSWRHQNGDLVYGITGDGEYHSGDGLWNNHVRCNVLGGDITIDCTDVPGTPPEKLSNVDDAYTIYPKALQISTHKRWGFNLSNTAELHPRLHLTLSGDFTKEKLRQSDASEGMRVTELTWGVNHLGPRSGTRQQWDFAFNFDWKPVDWLQLYAGARYSDYWSFDDGLAEKRANQVEAYKVSESSITAKRYNYYRLLSDEEVSAIKATSYATYQSRIDRYTGTRLENFLAQYPDAETFAQEAWSNKIDGVWYTTYDANNYIEVPYNNSFEGFADNNPFLNGTIDLNACTENAQGQEGCIANFVYPGTNNNVYSYATDIDSWQQPEKKKGHAWAPQFGANISLTQNTRLYARYAEFIRFPSLYEDTQAVWGYKATYLAASASKPEHAYNWEVGYVHNLADYFPSLEYADFRINYFHNTIHDYIDRDNTFNIVQFDKKKMTGIELQTRMDSGRFFANLAGTYRLKNEMCDRDYASYLDPVQNRIPACITAGFPFSFSRTSLQPKYSINLDVGTRLMDRKLEIGGRMTYHSSANNKDEEALAVTGLSYAVNRPYYWNPIWVFDAYASYQVNDNLSLDLGINNITNRYYIDPLARVMQPAPGRTIKAGLTARF
ncbi:TonB-dependent receptor [Kerstersia gyiorum]|uniref:TonB-dependent receptor domain-containing protein n=1 Tax=Kerstersia gyiorum TaxID=206506 RepID=UPI00214FB782|nr:TonB-dependent receptor [Kerstersia gyiorum]MCR4159261.1 TonB-dependent receptor [Kerstersia gyiorum]